jgi:hypothetical protein
MLTASIVAESMPRDPTHRAPFLTVDPALGWVLQRAFGPVRAAVSPPPDPAATFATAHRLDLAARIASRLAREQLDRELGTETAARFARERSRTVSGSLRLRETLSLVADLARTLDPRAVLVPLKGAALLAAGHSSEGARNVADLDLLVAPDLLHPLAAALASGGFAASARHRSEHHLAALVHPVHGVLELHDRLLGVELGVGPGGRRSVAPGAEPSGGPSAGTGVGPSVGPGVEPSVGPGVEPGVGPSAASGVGPGVSCDAGRRPQPVTLAALAAADLLRAPSPATAIPHPALRFPAPPVLAAHAIVHAVAFHGDAPRTYPTLRALADLVDLLPALGQPDGGETEPVAPSGDREAPAWQPLAPCRLDRHLGAGVATAALELAHRLAAGDARLAGELAVPGRGTAARLLAHLLAGQLDADYARSLRLRAVWFPASDRPALWARAAALRDLLWLRDADLEAIYGHPSGRAWHWRRRLWRPLDLARRSFGAWRVRRGGSGR